jgi:tRNA-specific 2-thiouridylase
MHLIKNRVVVGMSGGVDSTVAAYLLKQQGYEVIGVTMKTWDDPSEDYVENYGGCCSLSSIEDARRVADKLEIPFYVVNFKAPFKTHVIDPFVDSYFNGETPNPCIECNRHIKFDLLLKKAFALGANYIATGHYARITFEEKDQAYHLYRSKEAQKDQTYMLYTLTQEQLAHTLMPLGSFESKEEVRKIAESLDWFIAKKSDSQEICFIPDDDYIGFIKKNAVKPIVGGNFVDETGKILAKHPGIIHYTVGQRKGLGVTFGKPAYVKEVRMATNEVVIGDAQSVYSNGLVARLVTWVANRAPVAKSEILCKVRHTTGFSKAVILKEGAGLVTIQFAERQRAVTPGQSVVFYDGEEVLGGGIIDKALD